MKAEILFTIAIIIVIKGKDIIFYSQVPSRGESATTICGVNDLLLAVMLLKQPNEQLLVAIYSSQLRILVSSYCRCIWMAFDTLPFLGSNPCAPSSANEGHKYAGLCQRSNLVPAVHEYIALPMLPLKI